MTEASLGGRLPLIPVPELSPVAHALYGRLAEGRLGGENPPFRSRNDAGEMIGPYNACLHMPEIGGAFLSLHEAEEKATPLSARTREVIILSVGAVWRCAYELYAHKALAGRAGLPPQAREALAQGRPCDELDETERAAQQFALEITRERRLSDDTYERTVQALGQDGVVAATFLAGAYALTCTLLNTFAAPAPDQ